MRRTGILIPLVLASIIAIGVTATQLMHDAEAAGALLSHPSADCTFERANVTLKWAPMEGASEQWIEYSLHDNGFAEGTYASIPVAPDQSMHILLAPQSDLPNFWRVVSRSGDEVIASNTSAFMPCERPILLWGPMECQNFFTATVRFRWAPLANNTGKQYLEIDHDGNFTGSDLRTTIPMSSGSQELRRGGFDSGQTYHFRVVLEQEDGTRLMSQTGWFTPDCMPHVNPVLYGSDDRLHIPAIGVDAPINVLDVGWDGVLGVPSGGYDVVRYNFALFPNLYGEPGSTGPKLIGGHLDYHVIGPAIFWDLATLKAGDTVEYWDGGVLYTYVVDWVTALPFDVSLNSYVESSTGDTLLLITCEGEFDRDLYGGYNQRTLVHAVRQ